MRRMNMTAYTSETGYIKRKSTGEIFNGSQIFLGKFDKLEDYEDALPLEWQMQEAKREEELKSRMPKD